MNIKSTRIKTINKDCANPAYNSQETELEIFAEFDEDDKDIEKLIAKLTLQTKAICKLKKEN
jgi:hypothetical protein